MGTQPVSLALPAPLELGAGAKAAQAWLPLVSPHTLHWHVGLLRQGCAPRALQWVLWLKRMGAVEQLSSSGRAAPRAGSAINWSLRHRVRPARCLGQVRGSRHS